MHCCIDMERVLRNGDVAITYIKKFHEYGILNTDGGTSYQIIHYCPWCGRKLPASVRDKWFDEIEKLGMEPDDPKLPKIFLTDEWLSED